MFAAYLDESFDPNNEGIFAVAAIVGDGWEVLRTETAWIGLLRKHGLKVFKASRVASKPDVYSEFVAALSTSGLSVWATIVQQEDFFQHFRSHSKIDRTFSASPYRLLYQWSFVDLAGILREEGHSAALSFVCDENARYAASFGPAFEAVRELNPLLGSCSLARDEECVPLQIADMMAYEVRRLGRRWKSGDRELPAHLAQLADARVLKTIKDFDETCLKQVSESVASQLMTLSAGPKRR